MSFASSLFRHTAHAIATVTVGVLRDVSSEACQRIARALDPRPGARPPRHDALARAAERLSPADFGQDSGSASSHSTAAGAGTHADTSGGAALIAGGLLGVLVAVVLASRR